MFKNKNKNKILIIFLISLATVGALYIHNIMVRSKEEIYTLRVWVGERSALYLPLYVALEEGYFDEQKIQVKLNRSSIPVNDPYAIDLADIIITDPVECLYQKSVNPSSPIIIAALTNKEGSFLLSREKRTFDWGSLKGKNIITYPPETTPGLAMEKILRSKNMLPMHDLCLYNRIAKEFRLGAFKSGSGSYIQLSGPAAVEAEKNGTGYIAASLGKEMGTFPSVLCVAWPELIDKNPEAIQGFVNGIYKAQLWLQKEPKLGVKAAKIHLKNLNGETRNKVLQSYKEMNMWLPTPWIDKSVFKDIEQMMVTNALIAMPITFDYAANNTFALQAAETIKYIPKDQREGIFRKLFH